jgi:hypothetical protein
LVAYLVPSNEKLTPGIEVWTVNQTESVMTMVVEYVLDARTQFPLEFRSTAKERTKFMFFEIGGITILAAAPASPVSETTLRIPASPGM